MSERRCSCCGEVKPVAEFYTRSGARAHTRYSACKQCHIRAAHRSRSNRRRSVIIREAIREALRQHGPLSTPVLCVIVTSMLPTDDSQPITTYVIGQNAKTPGIESTPKKHHGSIWRIAKDPRYQPAPQRRTCYIKNIGMDDEHLAWMAEQQARAAQRRQQVSRV